MRRGCISLGNVQCDECHLLIPHSECYLVIEEEEGGVLRLCVDCSLKKGFAHYRDEKGDQVLTFFSE